MTQFTTNVLFVCCGILVNSCGPLERFDLRSSKSSDSQDDNSISTVSSVEGTETATLIANSGGVIRSTNLALSGTAVTVDAGALSIDTKITIEEGSSLAEDSDVSDLGIGTTNPVQSSGTAVVVESSSLVDALQPMAIQIPAPASSLYLEGGHLLVIAKVKKAESDGQLFIQVLKDFVVHGSTIIVKSKFFGIYQAIILRDDIANDVEKPAQQPFVRKAARDPLSGTWDSSCHPSLDNEKDNERSVLTFSGANFGARMEQFAASEANCTGQPLLQVSVYGEYQLPSSDTDPRPMDYSFRRVNIRFSSKELVKNLNQQRLCGKSDWDTTSVVDVTKDFGTKNCFENSAEKCSGSAPLVIGQSVFGIFELQDGVLRLGEDSIDPTTCKPRGRSVEDRVTTFDDVKYIRRN